MRWVVDLPNVFFREMLAVGIIEIGNVEDLRRPRHRSLTYSVALREIRRHRRHKNSPDGNTEHQEGIESNRVAR